MMLKRGVLLLGGFILSTGCGSTGAKRPEQMEPAVQEFVSPPPGAEKPPDYPIGTRPAISRPNTATLDTGPANGGVGMPSPSPSFTPNNRVGR